MSQQQANLPATYEPLPKLDTRQPASMLSLPLWLEFKLASLGGSIGKPTIRASMALTEPERGMLERRITQLQRVQGAGDPSRITAEIGKLMAFYATGRTNEQQMAVKIAIYVEALQDMPDWAVAEAVRRWFRGDIEGANTEFAPSPALLRRAAEMCAAVPAGQAVMLRRLLRAEPEHEFTDEEREANMQRLAGILKPVMKEGVE
jgi:hypothetical protein